MLKEIGVFAPATVSNIGCGFDIMGFALEEPGDNVIIRRVNGYETVISKITGDDGRLPYDTLLNTASIPVLAMKKDFGVDIGLEIEIHKKMPFGSGLGSSAASSVAATYAFNELAGLSLSKKEMLGYALKGEMIASGTIHADNIAPCLYGGFTLIRGYNPIDVVDIDYPNELYCAIIHPDIEISTRMAREILPKEIQLSTAIKQWGNCSGLVAGLLKNDFELIGRSMEDFVAEPLRSKLIPHYDLIKRLALSNGAVGCSISGSGPSIFAITKGQMNAVNIIKSIKDSFSNKAIKFDYYISKINKKGPKVLYIK